LFDCVDNAQNTLNRLNDSVLQYGMRFAPSKCKVLVQDWNSAVPNLSLDDEVLDVVDNFTYLGSCVTNDGSIHKEISLRVAKARAAYAGLGHLWRRKDVSLKTKARVYNASVRSVLLYGCETWALRAEDTRRLETFDQRCLRRLAKVRLSDKVSSAKVRHRVFGEDNVKNALGNRMELSRLRWLGHVLRMQPHRLPYRALFSTPSSDWRKPVGGQQMTWYRNMKASTKNLVR
jgi:hypothetical protein